MSNPHCPPLIPTTAPITVTCEKDKKDQNLLTGDRFPSSSNLMQQVKEMKMKKMEELGVYEMFQELSQMLVGLKMKNVDKIVDKLKVRHEHFNPKKEKKFQREVFVEFAQKIGQMVEERTISGRKDVEPAAACYKVARGFSSILKTFKLDERLVFTKLNSIADQKNPEPTLDIQILVSQCFLFFMSILDPEYNK